MQSFLNRGYAIQPPQTSFDLWLRQPDAVQVFGTAVECRKIEWLRGTFNRGQVHTLRINLHGDFSSSYRGGSLLWLWV